MTVDETLKKRRRYIQPVKFTTPTDMTIDLYPITYMEELTGLTSSTLRKWEYEKKIPRTWFTHNLGMRLYSADQIRILNMAFEEFSSKDMKGRASRKINWDKFVPYVELQFDSLKKLYFGG